MTLVSTETGFVGLIRKVAAEDEEAARQLVRLSVYEALCDLSDVIQPEYEARVAKFVAERSEEGRRALVRSFVERRLAGEDVDDVIKAASYMTLVEVGKADNPNVDNEQFEQELKERGMGRDKQGRFARAGSVLNAAVSGTKNVVDVMDNDSRGKQVAALGRVLTTAGEPALGTALVAAGNLGPQAERVLGPGLQRTAYRFRGVERRPTSGLMNATRDHVEAAMARAPRLRGDAKRLQVQGDAVAAYMVSQLPRQQDAEVSLASGRVPPSRGAIIDADGDIISEAHGVEGDHYVPFDLKNLGRMEGGQYVRTRAAGGPTREDLYTGLMSGARQAQVVSHSGVFTVEFDPSLRGSRRYSDQARKMVGRYQEILDAIQQEKVTAVPLDQQTMATLRDRALRQAGGDTETARAKMPQLVREEMQRQAFERDRQADDAEVAEAVQHRVAAEERKAGGPFSTTQRAAIARQVEAEVREQQRAETPRALRLDGEGYARALEALQGEFPYFIRDVRHETLRDFADGMGMRRQAESFPARGPKDRGFVTAGANLPAFQSNRDRTKINKPTSSANENVLGGEAGAADAPRRGTTGAAPTRAAATESTGEGGVPVFVPRDMKRGKDPVALLNSNAEVKEDLADDLQALDALVINAHNVGDADLKAEDSGAQFVNYVFRKVARNDPSAAVDWALNRATPEQRAKFVGALHKAAEDLRGSNLVDDMDKDEAVNIADRLELLLKPTVAGPKFSAEKATAPVTSKTQAYSFAQIDALGTNPANFQAWAEQAAASNPVLRTALEEYANGNPRKDLQARTQRLRDLSDFLSAPQDFENPDGINSVKQAEEEAAQLTAELPLRHLAWSFVERRMGVESLKDLLSGTEGEESPHPSEEVDYGKRYRPVRRSSVRKRQLQPRLEQALLTAWSSAR